MIDFFFFLEYVQFSLKVIYTICNDALKLLRVEIGNLLNMDAFSEPYGCDSVCWRLEETIWIQQYTMHLQ